MTFESAPSIYPSCSDALRLSPPPHSELGSRPLSLGEVVEETELLELEESKVQRRSFGREDLDQVYRKTKDLLVTLNVFRIAQYAEENEVNTLIICNLWKIERLADRSVKYYNFDIKNGSWVEDELLEYWPEVPFYPIRQTQSLSWWRNVIRRAIWKVMIAAGYQDLPRVINEFSPFVVTDGVHGPVPGEKKEMLPKTMADIIFAKYLGKQNGWNKKRKEYKWKDGILTSSSMMSGARALRAAFFQHILDNEVLSAMLCIDYKNVSFIGYLRFALYRNGLLKVSKEHRNLLPILPKINPRAWGRDDLFSRKLWVKDGRKTTALERKGVKVTKEKGSGIYPWSENIPLVAFEHQTAWRWLSKASSVIVSEWNVSKTILVTNIALANISVKAPVYAYVCLLRKSSQFNCYGVSPAMQCIVRCFINHCAKMWKEKGFKETRHWLKRGHDASENHFSNIFDYLDAEGFALGYPNKHTTWASLSRHSEDWHNRIAIENMERELSGIKIIKWSSLIKETEFDGVTFTPLENSKDLAVEGYQMHHCVRQYAGYCQSGKYRVFSVVDAEGIRSTLGLSIKGSKVVIDQHMGKYNGEITQSARNAGLKILSLYDAAMKMKTKERKAKKK